MKEISYKTAILAKEKFYRGPCSRMYNEEGGAMPVRLGMHGKPNDFVGFFGAPRQAELQEWLREKNIEVEVHRSNFGYDVDVCDWRGVYCDCSYSREDLGSYEEALEEGLYRALLMLA